MEEIAFRGAGNRHQLFATEARLFTESNLCFEALCQHVPTQTAKTLNLVPFSTEQYCSIVCYASSQGKYPVLLHVQMCCVGRGVTSPSGAPERLCSTTKAGTGAHCVS